MKRVIYTAMNRKIDRVRRDLLALNNEDPKNPIIRMVTRDPKLTITFQDQTSIDLNIDQLTGSRWLVNIAKKMRIRL